MNIRRRCEILINIVDTYFEEQSEDIQPSFYLHMLESCKKEKASFDNVFSVVVVVVVVAVFIVMFIIIYGLKMILSLS